MKKMKKKPITFSHNIIIVILSLFLLSLAIYIAYDKYFGPTYDWFNYKKNNPLKIDCTNKLLEEKNNSSKIQQKEFEKVKKTFEKAKDLINSEYLLSPYIDVNVEELKLSCQKIQKDLLAKYFSDTIINNILTNYTINNEFVNCIIKETQENYGPRNIFNNSVFQLENDITINSLAHENNYYLISINNNYLIFEKTNDVWKINQY
ncbi:MAG: hypothetical protein IJO33_01925 [Bacilli bacterium]|nr:hypothetical protein [Bacilli bacterium]